MCPPYIPGSRTSTTISFHVNVNVNKKKKPKTNPYNLGGKNTRFEVTSRG